MVERVKKNAQNSYLKNFSWSVKHSLTFPVFSPMRCAFSFLETKEMRFILRFWLCLQVLICSERYSKVLFEQDTIEG